MIYVRLLSYENACKVIDFVGSDLAYITTGGVAIQEEAPGLVDFLDGLGVRYEIENTPPYKVVEGIIQHLKEDGIIN